MTDRGKKITHYLLSQLV